MVGSLVLQVDSMPPQTETMAPYTLTPKNASGNYAPWTLTTGAHTLLATPYDAPNATGNVGAPLTVTFTLSSASTASTGGAPGIAGAAGAPPVGVAGAPAGTGGVVTGVAAMSTGGAGFGGSAAGAGGALGFGASGFGGLPLNAADGSGAGESSCGCRIGERSTDARDAAFIALAASLGLRRRRRRSSAIQSEARARRIPHTG